MREAIEAEGGEILQLHEYRVRGEYEAAHPRALRRNEGNGEHQGHGADEQVGVDRKERRVCAQIDELIHRPVTAMLAEFPCGKVKRNCEPGVLGEHRRQRHAVDLHAQHEHEQEVQRDVGQVDGEENDQRDTSVLEAEEPADHHEIGERARCAPDTNGKILEGMLP